MLASMGTRLCRSRTFQSEDRSVGDIVVDELAPLHDVEGVDLAGVVHVRHDVDGDEAGGGKGDAAGLRARLPHACKRLRESRANCSVV